MILAKSKKLLRDVKWFGRRMILHSRYWISWSGRPSAYLPGFTSGSRVTLVASFSAFFFAARFGIVVLNVAPTGRLAWGAAANRVGRRPVPKVRARGPPDSRRHSHRRPP